jgi:hypothetical protein
MVSLPHGKISSRTRENLSLFIVTAYTTGKAQKKNGRLHHPEISPQSPARHEPSTRSLRLLQISAVHVSPICYPHAPIFIPFVPPRHSRTIHPSIYSPVHPFHSTTDAQNSRERTRTHTTHPDDA